MFWNRNRNTKNANLPTMSALERQALNVEKILASIRVDPAQARMAETQGGYGWSFQRGSALIEVYLAQQDEREYFQVLSPIMHLPPGNLLPFYRRLLELNLSLTNASLGVYLDVVYVFNERPVAGLDANEANFIITQIAEYADDLDNQLVNEFGGRLYSQV